MSSLSAVALDSAVILVAAWVGALVPLFQNGDRSRTEFLAFAAGVMLGAAFFHMLPEAVAGGRYGALAWVPVGFAFLYLLERYLLVHVCEEPPDCAEHTGHGAALGLAAFLGLSVHTVFDGVALASSVVEGIGVSTLVAIAAHKVPASFSLASILRSERRGRAAILLATTALALTVPLGAALYFGLQAVARFSALAPRALAFSAGSFLYLAVADLLPHVRRHGQAGRGRNALALVAGLSVMALLARWVGHHG